jgi:hypothetical protein
MSCFLRRTSEKEHEKFGSIQFPDLSLPERFKVFFLDRTAKS